MELVVFAVVAAVAWSVLHRGTGSASAAAPLGSAPDSTNDGAGLGAVGDWMNELEKKWEGFRASVYDDGAGNPTIGYGHKLTPGESFPGGIDQGTANQLLQSDVSRAQAAVRAQVTVPLTDSQFGALVDWVFNLGPGNLHSSTMLQKLNAGDYSGAAAEMLRWNRVNGQVSAGLEARRADEVSMWNS